MSELQPSDRRNAPHNQPTQSRRAAIRSLAAAATLPAVGLVNLNRLAAQEVKVETAPRKDAPAYKGHKLYVVVPKDARKFDEKRREALDVLGPGSGVWVGSDLEFGYLAWLTAAAAEKIAKQPDIRQIKTSTPSKPELGRVKDGEKLVLIVAPAPNGWKKKPLIDSFRSNKVLSASWSKSLGEVAGVQVSADKNADVTIACHTGRCRASLVEPADVPVTIRLPNKKQLKDVLKVLEKDPQFYDVKVFTAAELKRLRERPPIDGCPGCGLG